MELKNNERIKLQLEYAFGDDVLQLGKEYMQRFQTLMAYYRCAMMEIETKLNVLNEEFSLRFDRNPINSIKTRLKSAPSMHNKLERLGLPLSVSAIEENLNDIAGVRVICAFPDDILRLYSPFTFSFSSKLIPLVIKIATNNAATKATNAGIA